MPISYIRSVGYAAAGLLSVVALTAAAQQVSPPSSDPLARMRATAAANGANQACSVSETSACAQANPKILANALGSPALAANLKQLAAILPRSADGAAMAKAIAWSEAAFRAAGADTVSADPDNNVIAEIRGRETPNEFVMVAANLDPASGATQVSDPRYFATQFLDDRCNVAMLVEMARDIHLTGLRPRRSIRFVLFGSRLQGPARYVHGHRDLDDTAAAVIFENGCSAITGFNLGGREELEPGVRVALDFAPIKPWGGGKDTFSATFFSEYFDLLLQGVPSLTANRISSTAKMDLDALKKNTVLAGVLAFGLAERAVPLGSRLTHAQTELLLERSGLKQQMQATEFMDFPSGTPPTFRETLWDRWQSGELGRQP